MRNFLLVILLLLPTLLSAQTQVLIIKAGLLIDPETGKATPNQFIKVEDGIITAVGAKYPHAGSLQVQCYARLV